MKKHWIELLLTTLLFAVGVVAAGAGTQMAFIGALVGALASVGGAVANGVMSANANNEAERKEKQRERMRQRYIADELKEENEDYASNINERAMYRYTAQYNANKLSEALREQLKDARGRQTVMGGTDEAIAAQMENNANAMSDYYGNVEMAEEQRKKELEQAHKERKRELRAAAADVQDQALTRQAQFDRQRGQNIASAVGSGINALGSIATGLDTRSIKRGAADTPQMEMPDVSNQIRLGFNNYQDAINLKTANIRAQMAKDSALPAVDYYSTLGKNEEYAKRLKSIS